MTDRDDRAVMKAVKRTFPVYSGSRNYLGAWLFDGKTSMMISDISSYDADLVAENTSVTLTLKNRKIPIRSQWPPLPSMKLLNMTFVLPGTEHTICFMQEVDFGSYETNGALYYEDKLTAQIIKLFQALPSRYN